MTAPAHVLVFRPIIERLRGRGHEVEVTARDYSQTVELLRMHDIDATVFGRHGGASRPRKALSLARRTLAMRRFGAGRDFDLALAHGSNDLALADLVLSAGGTMNREAVALGTPVYTTYGGRMGGVDEALIREGRLRPLTDPASIQLRKRSGEARRMRRDPDLLVDLFLDTPR